MKFSTHSCVAAALFTAMLGTSLSLRAQESPAVAPPATAPAGAARGASGTRGTTGRGAAVGGGGRALSAGGLGGGGFGGGGRSSGSFGGGVSGASASLPPLAQPEIATDGPSTTLNATVYNVRLPLNQIGRIDIDALTKAAGTPADFEKALAALGAAHPIYHVDQSVRLKGDHVQVSTNVPYITNSQITPTQERVNSVAYSNVGAIFNITGALTPAGAMSVDLSIQVSMKADSDTAISDKVKAPNFQANTISHKGPVQPRQPFVVMSVDAGSAGTSGMGSACIARVIFGTPE